MNKNHWTAYWQTGVMTSLPMDFKKNYDGELATYWRSVVDQLPKQSQVLDVCTGNGAIAMLLQEISNEKNYGLDITAIDASAIDPQFISQQHPEKVDILKKITFKGNLKVEDLGGLYPEQFDVVVSQYGIEYCDTQAAAKAVSQVLKPEGQIFFVAHSPETDIHRFMRGEEGIYSYFDSLELFKTFDAFGQGQLSPNGFKNKLATALASMQTQLNMKSQPLFQTWAQAMAQLSQMPNNDLKQQRDRVHSFVMQYQHARERAKDMIAVSDKLISEPEWYRTFESEGLRLVEQGDIMYRQSHNAGHYFHFKK